jgi:transposase
MPRADDWEHRRFVFECAWLLSMGASVDEIAQVTGRSRPTVYRALDQARQWRWLSDSPRLTMPPGEERDELEQHIADSFKADQVRDSFGRSATRFAARRATSRRCAPAGRRGRRRTSAP